MSARTVSVQLRAQVADYMAAMGAAAQSTRQVGAELTKLGKDSPQKINDISFAAAGLGAALLGIAGYAVKAAMEFDKRMSEVAAVSGATGRQLQALRDLAIQTGQDTVFSATDAAAAEAELAKAGMSVADIMGGGLKGAVALAAAGQMSLADAATITATTLNMFQLQASQAGHVADLLAGAANTSAADMHDLGLSLQQVGLVAHGAGWSLEQTTGVLAAFADHGLRGSDGATSLKTAIMRLQHPVGQAAQVLDDLGISVYDANGQMVDAVGIAGQLQVRLGHLTQEQRDAALSTIFGSDAIRAANVLYSEGAIGIEHYTNAVNKDGAAADTAAKKMDNLAGDLEQLKGSLETVAIQSGSGTSGGLRILTQTATGAVNAFGGLPGPVQTAITVIVGVAGASLLAAAGLLKVRLTAMEAVAALEAAGPAGARAAAGLRTVGSVGSKLGLVGLAIFGVLEGYKALTDWIGQSAKPVTRDIDAMTRSLERFANTTVVGGELAKAFGQNLSGLQRDMATVINATRDLREAKGNFLQQAHTARGGPAVDAAAIGHTQHEIDQAKKNMEALDKSFAQLAGQNGGITTAKIALEQLARQSGLTVDQLLSKMPEYSKMMDGAALANTGAAKGFGDAAVNAHTLATSLEAAVSAGQKLTDVLNQLSGGHANFIESQIKANQAVQDLKDSLEKNGTTLDINTEKGRANMQSILDVRSAAIAAAQAKYEETGSVSQASAVWDAYVGQLRVALHAAGLNDAQINQLIGDLFRMPPSITSSINTPGLLDAIANAQSLTGLLHSLDGKVSRASVITTYYANQVDYRPGFAYTGGPIPRATGGIWEHAAAGKLREAATYTPASPGRYMIAEPQTGGEAFVPRHGNYDRSTAILDHAARWYGGRFVGGSGGTSGGGDSTLTLDLTIRDDEGHVLGTLRRAVNGRGGNVQFAVMGR